MAKDTQQRGISARERSNSLRRKASIDPTTGQPYHYDHRRLSHHDPARGRDPTPPPPSLPHKGRASWATLITQYQLEGSATIIVAMLGAHIMLTLLASPDTPWTSIDWVQHLTALIPPFLWDNASTGSESTLPRLSSSSSSSSWITKAFTLQYGRPVVDPATGTIVRVEYGKGWDDMYMVLLWILIWTGVREGVMTRAFIPLGRYFKVGEKKSAAASAAAATAASGKHAQNEEAKKVVLKEGSGNNKLKAQTVQRDSRRAAACPKEEQIREGKLLRFAEQGWLVLYDGCMWTFGMIQLYHAPYWNGTKYFWLDYPKTHLSATFKWYYLIQLAFWLQQLMLALLGIEKRRKDFAEFLIHHVITCLLVSFSYSFNLTSIGHGVLCAMDFSDIVLAACKMLKYIHKDQVADIGFVFFVITWIASRHYYYGKIIYSAWTEPAVYAEMGWDPSRGLYFTKNILNGFLFLLIALYAVLIFWLLLIFRVVIKVLKGENSEDVRSEDEAEEEEVEEEEEQEQEQEKEKEQERKQEEVAQVADLAGSLEEEEDEDDEIDVEDLEEMTFEVTQKIVHPPVPVDSPPDYASSIESHTIHTTKDMPLKS
ncbi:sphingosine N-acyltransferase lag1 [Actinomortierella ambigua]|nr:sphingosine N-acyltransferase lag1 [Actinomortierella ambigua]